MVAIERNGLLPSHYHIVKGPDGKDARLTHEEYFEKDPTAVAVVFDRLKHLVSNPNSKT